MHVGLLDLIYAPLPTPVPGGSLAAARDHGDHCITHPTRVEFWDCPKTLKEKLTTFIRVPSLTLKASMMINTWPYAWLLERS